MSQGKQPLRMYSALRFLSIGFCACKKAIKRFCFKGKGVSFPPSAAISAYTFYQTAPLSVLDGVDGALSRDAHYGQEAADKGDKHAYAED